MMYQFAPSLTKSNEVLGVKVTDVEPSMVWLDVVASTLFVVAMFLTV